MHVHYPVSTLLLLLLLLCFVLSEKSFFSLHLALCLHYLSHSYLSHRVSSAGADCSKTTPKCTIFHWLLVFLFTQESLSLLFPYPHQDSVGFFSSSAFLSILCCPPGAVWYGLLLPNLHTHTLSGVLAAPQSSVCLPGNTTADDGAVG